MTANEKITEAERWLAKIKNSEHRKDRTELKDNVSAFLNCANSIPDHLLEEYNQKFNLGITSNDKLYPNTFEKAAKTQNNTKATKFISEFNKEKKKVESDHIGKVLSKKRDLDTHRESQRPNKLVAIVGGVPAGKKNFLVNFQELSGDIDDNCEWFLDLMKKFIADMKNQFP